MRTLTISLALALILSGVTLAQTASSSATGQSQNQNAAASKSATKRRGAPFRATKEQIKQAQEILKQRGLYTGEATGKLDPATRAALRKYQQAEGLRVTGTLNRETLEKMNIALTEKQKAG